MLKCFIYFFNIKIHTYTYIITNILNISKSNLEYLKLYII